MARVYNLSTLEAEQEEQKFKVVGRSLCPASHFQVIIQRLNIDYICLANSSGLLPANSYI